ncbi:MAG: hypothetical protein DMG68_11375 [Acidobacteria bacterium]|nr:MAG: hypothetical protein DMG68_11375 [Acidobacteriota bacterium]
MCPSRRSPLPSRLSRQWPMPFCPQCGGALPENQSPCPICALLQAVDAEPATAIAPKPAPVTITGEPPYWLADDEAERAPVNRKAVAAFILGLLFFILPCAFLAVVLGHLSLAEIKKSGGKLAGESRAKAGLVLGYIGVGALPIFIFVAGFMLPTLTRARIRANEASAENFLQQLNRAQVQYTRNHPEKGYACRFTELIGYGLPHSQMMSGGYGVESDGYVFLLQGCSGEGFGTPNSHYQVTATPLKFRSTGIRMFCSNESSLVRTTLIQSTVKNCVERGRPISYRVPRHSSHTP